MSISEPPPEALSPVSWPTLFQVPKAAQPAPTPIHVTKPAERVSPPPAAEPVFGLIPTISIGITRRPIQRESEIAAIPSHSRAHGPCVTPPIHGQHGKRRCWQCNTRHHRRPRSGDLGFGGLRVGMRHDSGRIRLHASACDRDGRDDR